MRTTPLCISAVEHKRIAPEEETGVGAHHIVGYLRINISKQSYGIGETVRDDGNARLRPQTR
jgi:hypothetical protein